MHGRIIAMLALTGFLALGCGPGEPDGAEPGAELAGEAPADATAEAPVATHPDTSAEALWNHLEEEDYRANWRLWPGKGRLYAGTEPHGMLLTTYANDIAYGALVEDGSGDLPEGAILLKENYNTDSTFAGATVMQKVPGYNPQHQDWLFAKFTPDGGVDAFGRADGCQSCHQQATQGYVFTPVEEQ